MYAYIYIYMYTHIYTYIHTYIHPYEFEGNRMAQATSARYLYADRKKILSCFYIDQEKLQMCEICMCEICVRSVCISTWSFMCVTHENVMSHTHEKVMCDIRECVMDESWMNHEWVMNES